MSGLQIICWSRLPISHSQKIIILTVCFSLWIEIFAKMLIRQVIFLLGNNDSEWAFTIIYWNRGHCSKIENLKTKKQFHLMSRLQIICRSRLPISHGQKIIIITVRFSLWIEIFAKMLIRQVIFLLGNNDSEWAFTIIYWNRGHCSKIENLKTKKQFHLMSRLQIICWSRLQISHGGRKEEKKLKKDTSPWSQDKF